MIQNIEDLQSSPVVGQTYLVPCILGTYSYLLGNKRHPKWWPVLRPSHQDSKYVRQTRSIWKETDAGFTMVDEVFYEDDPGSPHHFHVDPRFAPAAWYSGDEQARGNWHNTVTIDSPLEWREMECVREMPTQVLFTSLGRRFVEDHKDKKMKCNRCPHKGILLGSVPVIDGVVTCPGHGLKFIAATGECITKWREEDGSN